MPIYRQKDGSYRVVVCYTDENGLYKQITKRGKKIDTKAKAAQIEAELLLNVSKSPEEKSRLSEEEFIKSMTFNELTEDYLSYMSKNLRATTYFNAKRVINLHLLPYFGTKKLNNITLHEFRYWKDNLDNYVSSRTKKPLNLIAKKSIYKRLNAMLNYAFKFYGYDNRLLPRLGDFKDREYFQNKRDLKYWTYDQFEIFIDALREDCIKRDDYRFWCHFVLYNILFFCGLRKGEAYALTWNNIQKSGMYDCLYINQSLSQKVYDQDGKYYLSATKNQSSMRHLPICKELLAVLENHFIRSETMIKNFSKDLFIVGGYKPISDTSVENVKNKYAKLKGLPKIKIHEFRHSFVSLLINFDVNIKTISSLVGHSTVDQTWNTYGHLYPDKENEAIERINLLSKNSNNI